MKPNRFFEKQKYYNDTIDAIYQRSRQQDISEYLLKKWNVFCSIIVGAQFWGLK